MKNSIFSIRPFLKKGSGIWVFTEPDLGLFEEAFVGEINTMINAMLKRAGLPKGKQFTGLFSADMFPGWHMHLKWHSGDMGGNWYNDAFLKIDGWLCPALFKFFDSTPKHIYVRAEA